MFCQLKSGQTIAGSWFGMSPKREAMVSMSSPIELVANVPKTKTNIEPGMSESFLISAYCENTRGNTSCHITSKAKQAIDKVNACVLMLAIFCESVVRIPKKSAGIASIRRPKKSLICETMIKTAMPLVKPITTATGINRMSEPKRSKPMISNMTPDIAVAMIKFAKP